MLCARLLIVGIGCSELQAEWNIVRDIHIVQIGVLAGILLGLRRARRGIGGTGAVPLSRISQAQTVVVADGIVHAEAVVVVGAVTAIAGLVAVGNALITQWMVGLMLHLSIAGAIGKLIRGVDAYLTLIVYDATTGIARAVFVLPPAGRQLTGELVGSGKVFRHDVDGHAPHMVFRRSRRHHLGLGQHGGGHLAQPLHHLVGTQRGRLAVDDERHGLAGEHDGAVRLAHTGDAGQRVIGIVGRIQLQQHRHLIDEVPVFRT